MAFEEKLLARDVVVGVGPLAVERDVVDEQHGLAVRQKLLYLFSIHRN